VTGAAVLMLVFTAMPDMTAGFRAAFLTASGLALATAAMLAFRAPR
jgi:hypothetical protein